MRCLQDWSRPLGVRRRHAPEIVFFLSFFFTKGENARAGDLVEVDVVKSGDEVGLVEADLQQVKGSISASPTACPSRGYGRAVGDAEIEPNGHASSSSIPVALVDLTGKHWL